MRIVNRKKFLLLPDNTMYCKYSSLGVFGELSIKTETTKHNDWWYVDLINGWADSDGSNDFHDKMSVVEVTGTDFRNDLECASRDGLYEDDQLFCIYDQQDIQQLIDKLKELQS